MTTGVLRGKSVGESWHKLRSQWLEANVASIKFWLLADAALFSVVPLSARVFFALSTEFVWVCVLSLVSNRDPEGAEAPQGEGVH